MMLPLTFICFAFIAGMVSPSQAQGCNKCRPGWEQFQGSCFAYADTPLSFGEAAAICAGFGARMAVSDTKEKNDFLKSLILRNGGQSTWLGGADALHEGLWVWMGTLKNFSETFTDWHAGEPNNQDNEDCLGIYQPKGYEWNDMKCTDVRNYICEYRYGAIY